VVGAGTVTSPELVHQVADLGAAFTVAPGLDERVAEASMSLGLDQLPGVATATEIQRALALGLRWQKAFPATVLGPEWFAAMRAPFPMARFVATGGITTKNARSYLDAGAAAISLGSAFAHSSDEAISALVTYHS
jgi:2-dehydro-3-deoxyphosphogluconate aldolase/(4S)-4-hydroxy-2-oxoglutarate aldolase